MSEDAPVSKGTGCRKGCHDNFGDHVRDIAVRLGDKKDKKKVTTDVHDNHTVDVTEHWEDRQDVSVKLQPLKMTLQKKEEPKAEGVTSWPNNDKADVTGGSK